eukprot:TRINITY_DN2340_c0_g1_i1.p1 TRINITY_DN2340_c0_g1~~TRINITY_DN2340_c0_g1_i1.p1  ORF type:complete len:416 (-),score=124.06 TRINITY_DN2340_c0_g1_i1:98-1294(-)
MKLVIVLLALIAFALCECPNACSGHGSCGDRDQCTCQRNWQGADCSLRTCPYGHAFIDTPQGDLNHDGVVEQWSDVPNMDQNTKTWESHPTETDFSTDDTTYGWKAAAEEGHHYMECSNAGLCNREIGECTCFPGYEGDACQRTSCPNSCSGNGVCRTVAEIGAGQLNKRVTKNIGSVRHVEGVSATIADYNLWDADKNQACVCDPGFTGADCSQRDCPRGDDPLTVSKVDCAGGACVDEKQTVTIGCNAATAAGTFQMVFEDEFGQFWKTLPITFTSLTGDNAFSEAILAKALTDLPQSVIPSISVDITAWTLDTSVAFEVEFTGNPGNLPLMTVEYSDDFCGANSVLNTVFTAGTDGTKEAITCSGRGLCDYTTGQCTCFRGYTGVSCDDQSVLSM